MINLNKLILKVSLILTSKCAEKYSHRKEQNCHHHHKSANDQSWEPVYNTSFKYAESTGMKNNMLHSASTSDMAVKNPNGL